MNAPIDCVTNIRATPKSAQRMAVEAGLGSVSNMARMSGRSRQTLHNWHRDYPALFELVLLGCVAKLKANAPRS